MYLPEGVGGRTAEAGDGAAAGDEAVAVFSEPVVAVGGVAIPAADAGLREQGQTLPEQNNAEAEVNKAVERAFTDDGAAIVRQLFFHDFFAAVVLAGVAQAASNQRLAKCKFLSLFLVDFSTHLVSHCTPD